MMHTARHLVLQVHFDERISSRLHALPVEELIIFLVILISLVIVVINPSTACRVFSLALLVAFLRTSWVRQARVQGTELIKYI